MSTRRTFIAGLGAAAAWPLAAPGQQARLPMIGYLDIGSAGNYQLPNFLRGLIELGPVEGRNFALEARFAATGQYDRLLGLASELVRIPVSIRRQMVSARWASALTCR